MKKIFFVITFLSLNAMYAYCPTCPRQQEYEPRYQRVDRVSSAGSTAPYANRLGRSRRMEYPKNYSGDYKQEAEQIEYAPQRVVVQEEQVVEENV